MLEMYRRHNAECKLDLTKKKLPANAFRQYTECEKQCPIWIEGTTEKGTIIPRKRRPSVAGIEPAGRPSGRLPNS